MAFVVAFFGFLLSGGQLYISYRLNQQDRSRDAARKESRAVADEATRRIDEIHVMVNSNLARAQEQTSEALKRVDNLERKLGLSSGEAIPTAAVVTQTEDELTTPPNPTPPTTYQKGTP